MSVATAHISAATREAVAETLPKLARALGRKAATGADEQKVRSILAALEDLAAASNLDAGYVRDAFDRALSEERVEAAPSDDAKPGDANLVLGAETRIVFVPGREDEFGFYVVSEVDDVAASHNPDCSANSAHTIAAAQPRDRSTKELCRQADAIAAQLDPSIIASLAPVAFDGPPVVNQRGEVIQGNGRAIALRVAYERYPEQARAYAGHLAEQAARFGLSAEAVRAMRQPVLVRSVEVTDERAVELGNILNTAEAEQAPLDRAKALVRRLSAERRTALGRELAELMRAAGDDATLRAALDQTAAVELLDYLQGLDRSGLLADGQLTPKGKDLLRDVLIGLLFDDGTPGSTARYEALSHTARMGIERAIGSIVALVGTDHDLAPRLQAAAEIARRASATGGAAKRAADVLRQVDAFEETNFSADDEAIADLLIQAKTQKAVAERLRTYVAFAEGYTNLFETVPPQPPAEAYRRAFVERERLNPNGASSAAELAFLGYLDALTVDAGREAIRFEDDDASGPVYLFATPSGRLLAVPAERVRPVAGPAEGDGSELYETWSGRPQDADAYAVDLSDTETHWKRLPKNGQTTQRLGTGGEIVYRSDKLIEEGDRKNDLHTYRHTFDAGKRPVYESGAGADPAGLGPVLVITDLAIDRRGILN